MATLTGCNVFESSFNVVNIMNNYVEQQPYSRSELVDISEIIYSTVNFA